jgi:galactose mutarotase-like enzyme
MLGASLRYRGEELLGRVDDIEAFALAGRTCGIPLLYPWANRLGGPRYQAAGREVLLDPASSLLHFTCDGLPMHGVPWSRLSWQVTDEDTNMLKAQLEWAGDDLLAVFPFPHRLEMAVALHPNNLTVETTLVAGPSDPVPVSFGFHPYLRLPGLPRAEWQIHLPAMRRLLLDTRQLPTGEETPFAGLDTNLDDRNFDDGFVVLEELPSFSVTGGGRRITIEFLEGYRYAQVYAPNGKDYLALEPMTAPTNALATGRGLRLVEPGGMFRAAFRVGVELLL